MIAHLSRRERVLIFLSALAVVVVAGWELLVQPIRDQNRLAEDLVPVRQRSLGQRQELIARKSAIAAELEQVNARIAERSARFLPVATPPVAAAEVQKIAKETASASGMEVRSERILPPVERGELLEIPVEIAVSGEIRNLVDLLSRLEQAKALMIVQDVKVRVMNIAQPKDLLATVTLAGLIMPAKAKT